MNQGECGKRMAIDRREMQTPADLHPMHTPAGKVGRRIRRLRRSVSPWMDQGELAHKIGMSQSNLSRIERGAVLITIADLCKVAEVFGVAASKILQEAGL